MPDHGEARPFAPFSLVEYRASHQDGLVQLISKTYADYDQRIELDTLDDDLLRIPEYYSPPASGFWVLVDEAGGVHGSVAILGGDGDEAHLKRLYLHRDLRGAGLGYHLAVWAVDWARRRGYNTLHIWSDILYDKAHALYEHLGAEDTGRLRKLGGVNDVDERYFVLRIG